MDKILDIGDIFSSKLADFSVPVIAVLVCAVAIFFLTRQEPKKFENFRLPRKTIEVSGTGNSTNTKKKKRSVVEQSHIVQPQIAAKQKKKETKEVKLPKKNLSDNKPSKNQQSTKNSKMNSSKISSEVFYDGEGEWQTVTTRRQKKNIEQGKNSPKTSPKKVKKTSKSPLDRGVSKLTEETAVEQSEERTHKNNKKHALRE